MLCEAVLKHSFWPLSARPLQDIHPMEVVKLMKAVEVIETPNKTTLKRFRHWSWNAHFLVWSLEDFWILKSRVGQWIQLESFLKKTASASGIIAGRTSLSNCEGLIHLLEPNIHVGRCSVVSWVPFGMLLKSTSFQKINWRSEKMLVTSVFWWHNVSYPSNCLVVKSVHIPS